MSIQETDRVPAGTLVDEQPVAEDEGLPTMPDDEFEPTIVRGRE